MNKPRLTCSREVLAHIDTSKPVHVYRNLHKNCLSVRQLGIVRCHVDNIVLNNATFVVNEKGRNKVRKEKKKNVHAYIKGTVVDARKTDHLPFYWENVYYNPYKCDFFKSGEHYINCAEWVEIDGTAFSACSAIIAFNLGYKKNV